MPGGRLADQEGVNPSMPKPRCSATGRHSGSCDMKWPQWLMAAGRLGMASCCQGMWLDDDGWNDVAAG